MLWRTFSSVSTATALNTCVGAVFWAIGAREFAINSIALATTVIALAGMLQVFGNFGIGTLVIYRLGALDRTRQRDYLAKSLILVGILAGCLAVVSVGLLSLLRAGTLSAVGASTSTALILIVGTGMLAMSIVFDGACGALSMPGRQVYRNMGQALGRLGLLGLSILVGLRSPTYIILAWVIPIPIATIGAYLSLRLPRPRAKTSPLAFVRSEWRLAARHHLLSLSLVATTLATPVVIAGLRPSKEVAWFNLSRNIGVGLLVLPYYLSLSLMTTTAKSPERLKSDLRRTVLAGLALSIGLLIGVAVLGYPVLKIYGGYYASRGYASLVLLLACGPFLVLRDQWVIVQRSMNRLVSAASYVGACSLAELAAISLAAKFLGIDAACTAWLICVAIESVIFGPPLFQLARTPPSDRGREGPVISSGSTGDCC